MKKVCLFLLVMSIFAFSSSAFAISFSFEKKNGNIYVNTDSGKSDKTAKNMIVTNAGGEVLTFTSNRNLWRAEHGKKDNFIRLDLDNYAKSDIAAFSYSEAVSDLSFSYYGGKNMQFNLLLENGDILSWVNDSKVNFDDMTTFVAADLLLANGYSADTAISSVFFTNGPNKGATGYFYIGQISFSPAPAVPVPAAAWLLGTGLAGLTALRRRAFK